MAVEQEIAVTFHMTFGKLVQKTDSLLGSADRDSDILDDYGITPEVISNILRIRTDFVNFPTDVEMNGIKVGKTKDKKTAESLTLSAIRGVLRRVALKGGKTTWQYKSLMHGDLSKMDDSNLCRTGYAVARAAKKLISDFTSVGLTQAVVDDLTAKTEAFDRAIDEQEEAVKARDKATQDRRILANSLYAAIGVVSEAGKAAFVETDEALYNDYVIYDTPTGNAIAKGTGMLTGEITDQDGTPVPEATVTVKGTTLVAVSDANGQYIVEDIPVGSYDTDAYKDGYSRPKVEDVPITNQQATELDFELVKDGTPEM